MAAELLAGIGIAAALASAWAGLALSSQLAEVDARLLRQATFLSEAGRLHDARQRLEAMQAVTETAVEGGTRATQAIHRGIASIPFGILAAIPVTRGPARVVRDAHDLISDGVYETISVANRFANRLVFGKKKND